MNTETIIRMLRFIVHEGCQCKGAVVPYADGSRDCPHEIARKELSRLTASDSHKQPDRPRFEDILMTLAFMLAKRSTCNRLQVGCVIATSDFKRILAAGYNGGAAGQKNGCDAEGPDAAGKCGCLHAEDNAVVKCSAPSYVPKVIFCTNLPCVMCCKRFVNLGGVEMVHFHEDYRSFDGLEVLNHAKIRWKQGFCSTVDIYRQPVLSRTGSEEWLAGLESVPSAEWIIHDVKPQFLSYVSAGTDADVASARRDSTGFYQMTIERDSSSDGAYYVVRSVVFCKDGNDMKIVHVGPWRATGTTEKNIAVAEKDGAEFVKHMFRQQEMKG
jgi:dCMP deaminase